MSLIGSDRSRAVVGLGVTGLSVARFLAKHHIAFYVVDSRDNPPSLDEIKTLCPAERIFLGDLEVLAELPVSELYVSPGIPLYTPVLKTLATQGVAMRGDIDLFCEYANAPIVAITGSNAKSTVTTLVGGLLKAVGKKAEIGGNIGLPALDILADNVDYYVLELSSFQLETTSALSAEVACVLNVSEDHMDRYDSLQSYQQTKQKIYRLCKNALYNKQDILTAPLLPPGTPNSVFTTAAPDLKEFGLIEDGHGFWMSHGVERLYFSDNVALKGKHNLANGLAALAMMHLLGEPVNDARIAAYLANFNGLAHRCELVAEINGVTYINDSKGTNVGATIAALEGFGRGHNIHLILGGDGKGADFSPLTKVAKTFAKQVYLFGQDAQKIHLSMPDEIDTSIYATLDEIMPVLRQRVEKGDVVLFSPACASLDQYANFNVRGEHFIELVNTLCK